MTPNSREQWVPKSGFQGPTLALLNHSPVVEPTNLFLITSFLFLSFQNDTENQSGLRITVPYYHYGELKKKKVIENCPLHPTPPHTLVDCQTFSL